MKLSDALAAHACRYPALLPQDILKFLYQATFGCEHLLSSSAGAEEALYKEASALKMGGEPLIEPLGERYSRVHLSYLSSGLSQKNLASLFFLSAKDEKGEEQELRAKLSEARRLSEAGLFPFSLDEFDRAVKEWERTGFPSLHHSEKFREAYRPAYRVISRRYIPFLPLFVALDKALEKGPVTLAIEGGSASGKSTLASLLESLYGATLFHMDDFFLQPHQRTAERYREVGGNIDRERFLAEVLLPLSRGETVSYRRFDCHERSLLAPVPITPKRLTVIEGAYSMHPLFRPYYSLSVFLHIDKDLQRERILLRNGEAMAKRFFSEWIPLEEIYFEKTAVKEACDLLISIASRHDQGESPI